MHTIFDKSLEYFVAWFNVGLYRSHELDKSILPEIAEVHAEEVHNSLIRQCTESKRKGIGVSELGHPAVLLALKHLGFSQELPAVKSIFSFHYGDWFESFLISLMRLYGLEVTHPQKEINFHGCVGHIDCVVDDEVVEIKTMNDRNFRRFVNEPSDAIYGYATQLSCYAETMQMKGVWLIINKVTRELILVRPSDELVKDRVARALTLLEALEGIRDVADIFDNFAAPAPEVEFYCKKPTGRLLVPESMRYSEYRGAFFDISVESNKYGRPTEYVSSVLEPNISIELLQRNQALVAM